MEQQNTSNSFLIVAVVVLLCLFGFFGYFIIKDKGFDKNVAKNVPVTSSDAPPIDENATAKDAPPEKYVNVEPNEHAKKKILETKEIIGPVVEVLEPAAQKESVRILTLQSDVIDYDKLGDVDFSKASTQLPLTRKEFKVNVNGSTKVEKGNVKDVAAGDFLYVSSAENIYDTAILTAVEIKILNKVAQ